MDNVETYKQSLEIELFLRGVLKTGSRDERILKGFYESLVFYEQGHTYMYGPAKHKTRIKQLLKYFDRAITKLSKKNPQISDLKDRLPYIDSSVGILDLYYELKSLMKKA